MNQTLSDLFISLQKYKQNMVFLQETEEDDPPQIEDQKNILVQVIAEHGTVQPIPHFQAPLLEDFQ